jgi:GNAT superfamily N-acetyltransferase
MTAITIEEAIEVFVRGFSFTRSFTFPCLAEPLAGGVWVVRDAPRTRGDYRTEEYVGHGVPPAMLDALARQHTRGRYRICAMRSVEESDAPLRAGFKARGYRLMATEAFMAHSLKRIESVAEPLPVVRVTTREAAEALAKAAGSRQILPEHLEASPAPMRQYVALEDDRPVGWVGSIAAAGCAWCANMFVLPAYRRRGIARALMTRMLQDDRAANARASVLLAGHTGAKLYPTVGYELIGELLMFGPRSNRGEQAVSDSRPVQP